ATPDRLGILNLCTFQLDEKSLASGSSFKKRPPAAVAHSHCADVSVNIQLPRTPPGLDETAAAVAPQISAFTGFSDPGNVAIQRGYYRSGPGIIHRHQLAFFITVHQQSHPFFARHAEDDSPIARDARR